MMKYLGLDIGSLFSKAVIVEDDQMLASQMIETTGKIDDEVNGLIEAVLAQAGIGREDLNGVGLTGRGAKLAKVGVVKRDDISCVGKAVSRLVPKANMVLEIGGQSITSILLDDKGGIIDFMRNDKCASGSGKFLEVMGAALGVTVERMDEFADRSNRSVPVSSQCGVFVESELITHVNEGEEPADIMAGIFESVAKIVTSQALKFGFQDDYTYTGGVGNFKSVIESANKRIRGSYHEFPYNPQFAGAIGAAMLAEEN
jgi:(R)-2-hydroxyacyl-CoA dehydratese activating ATPase